MEINTGMSGYGRTPRSYETTPKQESAGEGVATRIDRRQNALTGSSAVLSTSLASALWAVQEGQGDNDSSLDYGSAPSAIENSYFEFMN